MLNTRTSADPHRLADRLPAPPGEWTRTDNDGGIVEYRIAGDDGVCAAAKLTIRPDHLSERAVRLDRTQGCQRVGTSRFDAVDAAVETVETELRSAAE
ncbi:hypothetical protein [Natronomonas sp.]|uniref:hypothetical protein n=1 Tax=Natronomonas sp. TaxID=2184060 RepID=UPI00261733F9|nr:hypothetical protein [Natronomonas sp.]